MEDTLQYYNLLEGKRLAEDIGGYATKGKTQALISKTKKKRKEIHLVPEKNDPLFYVYVSKEGLCLAQ